MGYGLVLGLGLVLVLVGMGPGFDTGIDWRVLVLNCYWLVWVLVLIGIGW